MVILRICLSKRTTPWPLALVAIAVLALLWAARRSVRQRETATARRRAAA